MSRETILGLVTALEMYLEADEEAEFMKLQEKAGYMAERLNLIPHVDARVVLSTSGVAKTPKFPIVCVRIDEEALGISGRDLHEGLVNGDPSMRARRERGDGRVSKGPRNLARSSKSGIRANSYNRAHGLNIERDEQLP